MTDARLRTLARSADPGDRPRLLLERVRAGVTTPERLALAAYCGDEGARVADNGPQRVLEIADSEFPAWVSGLARWQDDREALVRVAWGPAWEALGRWRAAHVLRCGECRLATSRVEQCVDAQRAREALLAAARWCLEPGLSPDLTWEAWLSLPEWCRLTWSAAFGGFAGPAIPAVEAPEAAFAAGRALTAAAGLIGEDGVRAAVRRWACPWLCGDEDKMREVVG